MPPISPSTQLAARAHRIDWDWAGKLRHGTVTAVFCMVIAAVYVAFLPEHAYLHALVYSESIGISSWLLIDFGRHAFPPNETGWPRGWQGALLVGASLGLGYVFGNFLADQVAQQLGWATRHPDPEAQVRNTLLVSAVAGLICSYFFYSQGKSDYLERKMGEVQRHAQEARLKLLETQLEPHMLFNTLANLRALIGVDPARAQQMLDHMIAYLRATLSASRAATHPLQVEFDRLRDYLELMAIRMGGRLQFQLDLPDALAQVSVPALLLQPLVENSIQHGLEPKVEGGRISVSARTDAGTLVLQVTDTGVGVADAPQDGRGFGLSQIRERLATVYGNAASLQFHSRPGEGATSEVRLPLNA